MTQDGKEKAAAMHEATDLGKLIERVEAASGPDRELDCFLWAAIQGWKAEYDGNNRLLAHKGEGMGRTLGFIDREEMPGRFIPMFDGQSVPAYTGSIDAASALVVARHPGSEHATHRWSTGHGSAQLWLREFGDSNMDAYSEGEGKSVPLAILSALVRSLQSEEPSNG